MKLSVLPIMLPFMLGACARNWVNYPPHVVDDGRGGQRIIAARAAEFNGSDLNGNTVIDVSHSGVHIASAGGINNSISTAEGYRTARYGIGAAALVAGTAVVASQAANAYGSNQAAAATSNVAASKSAAAQAATQANRAITIQAIKAGAPLLPR